MFKKYNEIVICVDSKYTVDVEHFINDYVKVGDVVNVYVDGNKSYTGFKTKATTKQLSKLIEEKLYKAKVKNIVRGVVFLEIN